jgi:hypothetical protein
VWWPPTDVIRYPDHSAPVWEPDLKQYVDPPTREPLPTWDEALDDIGDEPEHVARFGAQVHAEGVLGGTPQADKLIGYLTKYLTKSVDACHEMTTARQTAHLGRLWAELRYTPCSPRCANWLRYGVQPKNARPNQSAGRCKTKVHQRTTLGMGGRRVLVSRQWSGKTLADHKADTRAWVRAVLGISEAHDQVPVVDGQPGKPAPFAWEMARNDDPDVPPLQHRLMRSISARIQQRAQLRQAMDREREVTPVG